MSKTCFNQFETLYRGRRGILNTFFKIPIKFFQLLSEIEKTKDNGGFMHAVANNSNPLL